ncbi:MAG: DUF1963 domain-containing protein [Pseudomonadota bacterium]
MSGGNWRNKVESLFAWSLKLRNAGFALNRYVNRNSAPGILLNRNFEKTGSLSFLGGTPLLPIELDWPNHPETGNAQPFLGQVNIADLPPSFCPAMPSAGVLYFFYDRRAGLWGEAPGTVLYSPAIDRLAPGKPDAPEIPIGTEEYHGGYFHGDGSASFNPFPITRNPKFELELIGCSGLREPNHADLEHIGHETGRIHAEKAIDRVELGFRAEAEGNYYSAVQRELPREYDPRFERFSVLSILDPEQKFRDENTQEKYDLAVSPVLQTWPDTWIFIGLALGSGSLHSPYHELGKLEAFAKQAEVGNPTRLRFLQECGTWIARARSAGAFTSLTNEERQEFRAWMSAWYLDARCALKEAQARADQPDASKMPQKELMQYLEGLQEVTEANLPIKTYQAIARALENCAASIIDGLVRYIDHAEGTESGLALAAKPEINLRPATGRSHQMFGHPRNEIVGDTRRATKVLLLQLEHDPAMFWSFGDVGRLQFWIDPQDLAAGRFDEVQATID